MKHHAYYVYVLLCSDGSCYTGMTSKLEQRLDEHNTGFYPRCYTYSRRPLTLIYTECYQFVHDAISREKQIKGWSRAKKEALMNGDHETLSILARNRVGESNSSRNNDLATT